jgi:hypothetical protein
LPGRDQTWKKLGAMLIEFADGKEQQGLKQLKSNIKDTIESMGLEELPHYVFPLYPFDIEKKTTVPLRSWHVKLLCKAVKWKDLDRFPKARLKAVLVNDCKLRAEDLGDMDLDETCSCLEDYWERAKLADSLELDDMVALSVKSWSERYKVPQEALRKQLEQRRSQDDNCYVEIGDSEQEPRDPRYLYRHYAVKDALANMSGECPPASIEGEVQGSEKAQTPKEPTPAEKRAWESHCWVANNKPEILSTLKAGQQYSKELYRTALEESDSYRDDEDNPIANPNFESWKRNLRGFISKTANRQTSHGKSRSAAGSNDLDNFSEISARYKPNAD